MQKRKKRIFVPILIVILFLGLAMTPGISATAERVKEHQIKIKMLDPYGTGEGAVRER